MNDDQEHPRPQMLTMHKRVSKSADGKRQLIFYTFDEANSPSYGAKRNRRGLGGGSSDHTTPQPPPLSEAGE